MLNKKICSGGVASGSGSGGGGGGEIGGEIGGENGGAKGGAKGGAYFTDEDVELMTTVAGLVSLAIHNHRLYSRAKMEHRRTEALVEAISASVEKGDLFDIIGRVASATTKVRIRT
jgi:GAF domain-containing protein